jgi:hypothetical protein
MKGAYEARLPGGAEAVREGDRRGTRFVDALYHRASMPSWQRSLAGGVAEGARLRGQDAVDAGRGAGELAGAGGGGAAEGDDAEAGAVDGDGAGVGVGGGAAGGQLGAGVGGTGGGDHQAVGVAQDDGVEVAGLTAGGELVVEGEAALGGAAVTAIGLHRAIVPRRRRVPKYLAVRGVRQERAAAANAGRTSVQAPSAATRAAARSP